MDNKRYLLALALSMGVIVVWSYFVLPPPKPPAPAERSPDRGAASAVPPAQPRGDTTPPTFAPEPTDSGASRTAPGKVASGHDTREEAAAEEEKTVETGLFRIHLGNRGARILGWELKRYLDDTGKPLELVSLAAPKLKCFPLDLEFTDPKLTEQVRSALFVMGVEPGAGNGETLVSFRYSDGAGLAVRKAMTLSASSYLTGLEVEASRNGSILEPLVIWGAGFGPETGLPPSNGDRNDITRAALSLGGSVVHKGREAFKDVRSFSQPGPALWAGLEDHYFAALILPAGGAGRVMLRMDPLIEEGREKQFLTVGLQAPTEKGYKFYVGPKDRELMASLNLGFEGIVNYGFLPGIAQALFFLLRHINQIVGNWGWAIIILTFVIRLAFFPLTHKSSVAMRRTQEKMKKIQPRIESIKKKYHSMKKDMANRQKMNEEIMALYGKEGMNPLAGMTGCLPLLLQLPILWGFYNLLVNAIELRHAPFGLWISDLSKKDPYYITPIVMGITMLVQQAMTGTSMPDPTQRRIMMLMPLMFTWFFKDLPSGLVLYWLVNNVLGIGQQYLINLQVTRESAPGKG